MSGCELPDMTPEQERWVRANWPGNRSRIPDMSEAREVFGGDPPEIADYICNTVTKAEAERIFMRFRRDELESMVRRDRAWSEFLSGPSGKE